MTIPRVSFLDDLPMLDDPIIAHEPTDTGWRGLTAHGEVISVSGTGGTKAAEPDSAILVLRGGKPVGKRAVENRNISIDAYLEQFNRGVELFRNNELERSLDAFDGAMDLAPNARAEFNRSLVLLTMGRWHEALPGYECRLRLLMPYTCQAAAEHAPRWHGEPIRGKRLLLVHDAGFGDTIQQLRYVPQLLDMGASVFLKMPPELERLAAQVAPLHQDGIGYDFWCPMLSLLQRLEQYPGNVPAEPYLRLDQDLVDHWLDVIGSAPARRIGIAWSVGRDVDGDYPRAIPLELLVDEVGGDEIWSLQQQGRDEAQALGVNAPDYRDFADVAAVAFLMDEIVTIDTAAAHVAGATGHGDVTVLLSHWHSWRWRAGSPFYPWFKFAQQQAPGDWASALAQL